MYKVWLVFPAPLLAGKTLQDGLGASSGSYSFGCLAMDIFVTGFLKCCITN